MASEEGTRYGDLCRLCATKTNMVLGIHIFENEGAIRQINKKIETCLPIQVHESDELPKMICENCLYKVELFFDFRERSARTETVLVNLFKEISTAKLPNDQLVKLSQSMNVVGIDQTDMIMIQHHQELLNAEHEMQNVTEIDLAHLQHRTDMIVENEIILSHQNVDISPHTLAGIDLNHHELSNQDLSSQESILVSSTNEVRYSEENLHLMQQEQLLSDHYRLQPDMQANITGNSDIILPVSTKEHIQQELRENMSISKAVFKQEQLCPTQEDGAVKQEFTGNTHNSRILKLESIQNHVVEHAGSDECNSNESPLLIDTQTQYDEDDSDDNRSDLYSESTICNGDMGMSVCLVSNSNNGELLHCNMCGKGFKEKDEFQTHYEDHFFKCPVCYAVFTSNDSMNEHQRDVHGTDLENIIKGVRTRCKPVTVSEKMTEALKTEHDTDNESNPNLDVEEEEDYPEMDSLGIALPTSKRKKWTPKECKECGKTYKTNYKLAEHMRKHTGEKPYKCGSCEKAFRSKIGLAQHEAKHTGQYDLSCSTCGKGFQCKSYLMVHQRVHSDVKPYPCTTCGRNFKTKQSLLDHTNRHLGVKPYMCDTCGRGFITKGLCKAHQKVHSGLDNRKYSCKVCNKMFVSKSYLQTHLKIHTGEKPFVCEVCGKGFLTRVDLRIHSTMHTGEKSYVCEMCGKAFARRDALRCHRRSHTGERPYSCDQCGQTFTQFSPMAIHRRLHTGERPYTCEVCGKSFVSRSTMMSHSRKHNR